MKSIDSGSPVVLTWTSNDRTIATLRGISARRRLRLGIAFAVTRLVGRDQEIVELRKLLTHTRLLTLVGTGGVGNARLAIELAQAVQDTYLAGVRLVELAAPASPHASTNRALAGSAALPTLTPREREVVALIAQGLTNREIAVRLVIAERTVDTHVQNILAKLGCATRTQVALRFAPSFQRLTPTGHERPDEAKCTRPDDVPRRWLPDGHRESQSRRSSFSSEIRRTMILAVSSRAEYGQFFSPAVAVWDPAVR